MGWSRYDRYPPYVSVADRKIQAAREVAKLKKKGQIVDPILLEDQAITKTFWGKAWCKNLETYSDFENRLPRGRACVRHGAVLDLKVTKGQINALVNGSSVYKVKITISPVASAKWHNIVSECAGKIDSLIELLQGKFSKAVMEIITHPEKGLFPHPKEIKLKCSCPDWADMCKHVAAALYGVGARLDARPEELFLLRQADQGELIAKAGTTSLFNKTADQSDQVLADTDLSSLFGIDIVSLDSKDVGATKRSPKVRKTKISDKEICETVRAASAKKKTGKKNTSATLKKSDRKAKAKTSI